MIFLNLHLIAIGNLLDKIRAVLCRKEVATEHDRGIVVIIHITCSLQPAIRR